MFSISEVRVAVNSDPRNDTLLGFATVTIDDSFVIRDVKIISARDGRVFVSFPTRRIGERCPACGFKNCATAKFCSDCGARQPCPADFPRFIDVIFPTSTTCRHLFTDKILSEYFLVKREQEKVA